MSDYLPSEITFTEREVPLMLVVDDDMVIRGMLKKALERHQYEVIEAPNGAEAVELFKENSPDMVLMDVLMPVMNGFEACEAIREIDTQRIVPILMLTGLDDITSVDKAFDAGATDFITKPINWSLFNQRIRYALRARSMDFALRKNQHRTIHASKIAKLGYWDWDLKSDRFDMPDMVRNMLGLKVDESPDFDQLIQFVPDDDKDKVQHAFYKAKTKGLNFAIEHKLISANQHQFNVYQQCDVIKDDQGNPVYVLGTIQDISALKRAEDLILHQAYHDILTDLPNQTMFKDRLVHALKVAEHSKSYVGVLLVDIDRFQVINESLGHDSGNMLLIQFASFLSKFVEEGDTVSRISGNEFGILLEGMKTADEVDGIIRIIRRSLNETAFDLMGKQVYITLSIGVAIYPDDDFDPDSLMQCAHAALRKAKSFGGDQEFFYTSGMNRRVHDRLRMEGDLRQALEDKSLELFYQPQVDVSSRKIVGMEALVRWNHPEFGLISPIRFIPLAEETGLIQPLGKWVLKEAIKQTSIWHQKNHSLRVGINLSAKQFMQADLVDYVQRYIQKFNLEPHYIDLEITESVAMQDAESSKQKMRELKALGLNLSMDDFGTGYSSLSYLHQFPLDVLKIDRSFVKDIQGVHGDGAIARAVIAMAHSMNIEVIAEGVETEEQYEFLQKYKCNVIQGFLISKPLPVSEFEKLL